ncbi:MAG: ABC transporter ATP-binding protein [Myxococcota bacterium]
MGAFAELLRAHRLRLVASAVLAVAAAALELAPALGIYAAALVVFAPTPELDRLPWIALAILGLVLLRYVFFGTSMILSHASAFALQRELRTELARKLAVLPAGFFDQRSPGDLKKAVVDDVDALEATFAHHVPELASGAVTPLLALGFLLFVDWRLALVSLSLVPVSFAAFAFTMRNFDELMAGWHAAERRANEVVQELFRGIVVLKAFGREASQMKQVRESVFGIRDFADTLNRRMAPAYTLFMMLLGSNLLVVLPTGVILHGGGSIDSPTLILFLALGYGITAPLLKLMTLFGDFQMNMVRIQRVSAILDQPPRSRESSTASGAGSLGIIVEDLSFAYDEERGPVLRGVDLEIQPGQKVALVGPSGSGKSTLAQLLAGARRPTQGLVALLDAGRRRDPLGSVSLVGQRAELFFGTLRDNLLMARPEATEDELRAALDAAGLSAVVEHLPLGWDTPIGERGAHLSGGEAQRVTMARAFLRDCPVQVLDEVTSHLDPDNERLLQQSVSRLCQGKTVILVAHRLRSVMGVDQLVVLDEGRVVDRGPHGLLLDRCPLYRRMWEVQQSAEGWRLGTRRRELRVSP